MDSWKKEWTGIIVKANFLSIHIYPVFFTQWHTSSSVRFFYFVDVIVITRILMEFFCFWWLINSFFPSLSLQWIAHTTKVNEREDQANKSNTVTQHLPVNQYHVNRQRPLISRVLEPEKISVYFNIFTISLIINKVFPWLNIFLLPHFAFSFSFHTVVGLKMKNMSEWCMDVCTVFTLGVLVYWAWYPLIFADTLTIALSLTSTPFFANYTVHQILFNQTAVNDKHLHWYLLPVHEIQEKIPPVSRTKSSPNLKVLHGNCWSPSSRMSIVKMCSKDIRSTFS